MDLTYSAYVGKWATSKDITETVRQQIIRLVMAVNVMKMLAENDGVVFKENVNTGTIVSGETYGGFRPQDCPIGAEHSSHKLGGAVDLYDPDGDIDEWCMAHQDVLETCGIYIEHPDSTPGWSHWSVIPPHSGHHVFLP